MPWASCGCLVRHREHPFFSADAPAAFVARLEWLAFSLAEEDGALLIDALDRIRVALDVAADRELFARMPNIARTSDDLARRMRAGEPGAFDAFVLFHRPLARKMSRRLVRWFGMDPDDAEQIATIGLLVAARRFRPELGYQFGTYAGQCIHSACERYGSASALLVRVPVHVFRMCFPLHLRLRRLAVWDAPSDARSAVLAAVERDEDL